MNEQMSDPQAIELISRPDGLPLAPSAAGAYLRELSTNLQNHLRHHVKSWLKLQRTSPNLPSYEGALYTTWSLPVD